MKNTSIHIIRVICNFFPPILSQKVRTLLFSKIKAPVSFDFSRKSFTGGILKGYTSDFHAMRFFIHGYFEWRIVVLVKKIIKIKPGDIIEVGANVGTETVSFCKINPNHNVYSFEPLSSNFQFLEKIKKINKFSNLYLYKLLVSDKSGKTDFQIPEKGNSGSGHILNEPTKGSQRLKVTTLDEELINISSCSVIIMDVEGFENKVIRGSEQIINTFKPYLILEVNSKFLRERAEITVDSLFNQLEQRGYTPCYIGKMTLKKIDIEKYDSTSSGNWICIPEEGIKNFNTLSGSIFTNAINPFIHIKAF